MSELKAFTFGLGQYMEDGSPCVVAFDGEKNPRLASDEKFYLKSEADKFISDLEENHKKEVGQLLIEIEELKQTLNNSRNARKYWRKEYLIEYKECCSQKYKRCLAMAKWCNSEAFYAEAVENDDKRADWLGVWTDKWEKLAEKFKTN